VFQNLKISDLAKNQAREKASKADLEGSVRVFQYLMITADRGIQFGENSGNGVEIFTDATWASDRETQRLQFGVLVFYHGDLIEWKSKRQ
jgi:hypothetical protein